MPDQRRILGERRRFYGRTYVLTSWSASDDDWSGASLTLQYREAGDFEAQQRTDGKRHPIGRRLRWVRGWFKGVRVRILSSTPTPMANRKRP